MGISVAERVCEAGFDYHFAMPVSGLNHFNLRAPRDLLERIRDFYCDVVGLREGWRPPTPMHGYWLYAGDNPVLHLNEAGPGESREAHSPGTFDHAAFDCSGLPEMEARLARLGIPFERIVVPGRHLLVVRDPAGNGVELSFAVP